MHKRYLFSFLVCLILAGNCLIWAQTPAGMVQPKVLWIYREDVKVARGIVHDQVERGYAELWAKAQVQPFLAVEAMSGNPTEVIFLSGYDSFASLEKDYQTFGKVSSGLMKTTLEALAKQEADLVNAVRSSVAIYRPELSYRADQIMPNMPKSRYLEITVMRTRPGKGESFAVGAKLFQSAYEKANINLPFAIYEIAEGAPSGTYLIFTFFKSLKEIDDLIAMEPKIMAAIGAEALKNMAKDYADTFASMESNIFIFSPSKSHVTKEFAAADPEFWTPKAKASPAPGGEAKKPAQ